VQALRRLRNDPLGLFAEAAAQDTEVAAFRAAHLRVFLAVGADAIAHVTLANRDNYRKGVSYDALRIPIGDSLLTADGATAVSRRRLLGPLFTRRAVVDAIPTMAGAVEDCCTRWEQLAARDEPIELTAEMNRLAFDVVGRVLLGAELGAAMTRLGDRIDDASAWVARRTRAVVPLPPGLPTPANRAYRRAESEIRAFTEGVIAQRKDAAGDDMLSRLLAARHPDGTTLTDTEVRDEIIGFLMAGHQTMGALLAWTWQLLAAHPDARAGVEAAADNDEDEYIVQVLEETLRLYPPGWAFTRTPRRDDELGATSVPAGSIVVICAYANQRSPRFWEDPERFDPERFAPGATPPAAHHFFPFGAGPHACIGRHLALVEAKLAIAMLARRFRVVPLTAGPVAPQPGITLTPASSVGATVVRRE